MESYLFPEGKIIFNGERIGILHDVAVDFEIPPDQNSGTKITLLARAISIGRWPLPESFSIELTGSVITTTLYKCKVIKLHDPDVGGNHRFLAEPDPERNNKWGTIKES